MSPNYTEWLNSRDIAYVVGGIIVAHLEGHWREKERGGGALRKDGANTNRRMDEECSRRIRARIESCGGRGGRIVLQ